MVEKIDGQGKTPIELEQELGFPGRHKFRFIWGDSGQSRLSESVGFEISRITYALGRLSNFPDFDERSYLVENAKDRSGKIRRLLIVPDDCPGIMPEDDNPETELPDPNETYLAIVMSDAVGRNFDFLILSSSAGEAREIALRRMNGITREFISSKNVSVVNISPEDFVSEAKRQIDEGIRQKPFILRYGDLREYQRARFAKNSINGDDHQQ